MGAGTVVSVTPFLLSASQIDCQKPNALQSAHLPPEMNVAFGKLHMRVPMS